MPTEAQTRENRGWLDPGKRFLPQKDKILGQISKTGYVVSFPGKLGKEWLAICPRLSHRPFKQEEPLEVILSSLDFKDENARTQREGTIALVR